MKSEFLNLSSGCYVRISEILYVKPYVTLKGGGGSPLSDCHRIQIGFKNGETIEHFSFDTKEEADEKCKEIMSIIFEVASS